MGTEMVRIESMDDSERAAVNILTPAERRAALVKAGAQKMDTQNKALASRQIARILSGELAPVTEMANGGQSYPSNGRQVRIRSSKELMEDVGRVPGYEGMHVLRSQDGQLHVEGGAYVTEPGEAPDWLDGLING